MGHRRVLWWDRDRLAARARRRRISHELHLARLLQGDEEVYGGFDRIGGDEDTVVLYTRKEDCRRHGLGNEPEG